MQLTHSEQFSTDLRVQYSLQILGPYLTMPAIYTNKSKHNYAKFAITNN